MVTVYRFHVYYKFWAKSGKLRCRRFDSVAFATSEIAIAALKSWSRHMKEECVKCGKNFEIINYYLDSSLEELSIDDIYCLSDCKKINCYGYASEYWLPF